MAYKLGRDKPVYYALEVSSFQSVLVIWHTFLVNENYHVFCGERHYVEAGSCHVSLAGQELSIVLLN